MDKKDDQNVSTLIARAVEAKDSNDAMRFAQAALNAANAVVAIRLNPAK